MIANELEKLRLSILDEAEQHKDTVFSIIVLAVLASALWLFSILEIKKRRHIYMGLGGGIAILLIKFYSHAL